MQCSNRKELPHKALRESHSFTCQQKSSERLSARGPTWQSQGCFSVAMPTDHWKFDHLVDADEEVTPAATVKAKVATKAASQGPETANVNPGLINLSIR